MDRLSDWRCQPVGDDVRRIYRKLCTSNLMYIDSAKYLRLSAFGYLVRAPRAPRPTRERLTLEMKRVPIPAYRWPISPAYGQSHAASLWR